MNNTNYIYINKTNNNYNRYAVTPNVVNPYLNKETNFVTPIYKNNKYKTKINIYKPPQKLNINVSNLNKNYYNNTNHDTNKLLNKTNTIIKQLNKYTNLVLKSNKK